MAIIIYNTEKELYALLQKIMPNIRILGSDYKGKEFTGNDLKSFPLYFNKKIKNVNFEIKELEKIALLNRLKGWIPKYRNELRIKYKNDYLNANYTYILLTYLRSILKLIV